MYVYAVGDRLSIDYGNNFYHPVRTRQKHLNHAYDFVCLCSACTSGVDPFRAFYCPKCRTDGSEGVMRARYPKAEPGVKSGVALESVYQNMDVEGEDEEDEDGEGMEGEEDDEEENNDNNQDSEDQQNGDETYDFTNDPANYFIRFDWYALVPDALAF